MKAVLFPAVSGRTLTKRYDIRMLSCSISTGLVYAKYDQRSAARVEYGKSRTWAYSARRAGKVLGQPRVDVDVKRLRALQEHGYSLRQIAAKTKLSLSTVARSLGGVS